MNTNLPFNWFDIATVLALLIGYTRGRKRGMSLESVSMVMWIAVVVVSAITYQPLAQLIDEFAKIGKLSSNLIAYLAVALFISFLFVFVKRTIGKRLTGSDTFGKNEYYLGIPAGIIRFACVILVFLALLNARFYTNSEITAQSKYDIDNYGSSFFPHIYNIQDDVFKKILCRLHGQKESRFPPDQTRTRNPFRRARGSTKRILDPVSCFNPERKFIRFSQPLHNQDCIPRAELISFARAGFDFQSGDAS